MLARLFHAATLKDAGSMPGEMSDFMQKKFNEVSRGIVITASFMVHIFKYSFLKACVYYFFQMFNFAPYDSPLKTMKNIFYFF